ncbi:MAG: hypothetical protein ACE5MI_10170 [Acidimicrobiia bacterium]
MATFLRAPENQARNPRPHAKPRVAFAADHLQVRMSMLVRAKRSLLSSQTTGRGLSTVGSTNSQSRIDLEMIGFTCYTPGCQ